MRLQLYRTADDPNPAPWATSWADFVLEVKKNGHQGYTVPDHILGDKDLERPIKVSTLMFSPCEIRPGGRRVDADAVAVHMGVVDLDHLSMEELADFLVGLEASGLEFLMYTAWSHGRLEGEASARVCVPFTRAVAAREWDAFWPRMNHALGGRCDINVKNVSRAYFLPSAPHQRLPLATIYHSPGKPLDVDAWGSIPLAPDVLAAVKGTRKVSREEVVAFQRKLAKSNPETGTALHCVLNGEPWADVGARDTVLFKLAGDLAKAFPGADPVSLAMVFQTSVTHMGDADMDWVLKKIQARQLDVIVQEERREEEALSKRKHAIRLAFNTDRDTPYTGEELEAFARAASVSSADFMRRWVIQKGSAWYFFTAGEYRGPYGKDDGTAAAHIYLAPATSIGLRLEELTSDGQFLPRGLGALTMEYGLVADEVVADLTAQASRYEPQARRVVEAPCPVRDLEPTFDPDVHQWLRLLGGSDYAALELWISYLTHLQLPCAALFFDGPPGCGKSLFALGAARIYTEGAPTEISQAMGDWTSSIANCPVVFADEKMATDWRGKARTADLRQFIQAEVRPWKRKFIPDGTMRGACRVILAANNRHILDGEDSLSPWDVQAVVGRIIHIEPSHQAVQFLRAKRWAPGTGQEEVIARHMLWMVENVQRPDFPPRFLVTQESSKLTRAMTTGSVMGSACAHWLVSFLQAPQRLRSLSLQESPSAHLVRVRNRTLWVNPRALTDHWDAYKTNVPVDKATAKRVSEGIAGLSATTSDTRVSMTVPGIPGRPKFYAIRTEDLVEWSNNHGHSTAEEILEALFRLEDAPQ